MSVLSKEELLSDQQAISGTVTSTNVYDRLAPGSWVHANGTPISDDLGNSCICLCFQLTEDFTGSGDLTVSLEQADVEGFGSAEVVHSETFNQAALVAGAKFRVRYVPHDTLKRYLRFNYSATNTLSGKVTAGFGDQTDSWGAR